MKVLLFTHSQDIDGAGCDVVAKVAFTDLKVVPTKTFDITSNVKKYIDDGSIYDYDQIFVTDLCIKEPVLALIDNDEYLKSHLVVLDHHKTEIDEGNDKYDFVNIIISEDDIKQSGTILFYKYLVKNNLIKRTKILDLITEYTRQYDVYDFKKMNNPDARKLHILFENLGYDKYVELMLKKVESSNTIEFTEEETSVIDNFEKRLESALANYVSSMKIVDIKIADTTYKVGYIRCDYKYRNDVNEYIIKLGTYDIDVVGMIMNDIDTVSYRQIKDIDISVIAKYFGGKGHRCASSNPQDNELFKNMLKENNI